MAEILCALVVFTELLTSDKSDENNDENFNNIFSAFQRRTTVTFVWSVISIISKTSTGENIILLFSLLIIT